MDEYKGIKKSEYPAWQGWKIIEDYHRMVIADTAKMEKLLEGNTELQELVAQFYQGGKQ